MHVVISGLCGEVSQEMTSKNQISILPEISSRHHTPKTAAKTRHDCCRLHKHLRLDRLESREQDFQVWLE